MGKDWSIVGYTADADTYCPDCAERCYGPDSQCANTPRLDGEGNEVHPIFLGHAGDWLTGAWCRSCGELLIEPTHCVYCEEPLDSEECCPAGCDYRFEVA